MLYSIINSVFEIERSAFIFILFFETFLFLLWNTWVAALKMHGLLQGEKRLSVTRYSTVTNYTVAIIFAVVAFVIAFFESPVEPELHPLIFALDRSELIWWLMTERLAFTGREFSHRFEFIELMGDTNTLGPSDSRSVIPKDKRKKRNVTQYCHSINSSSQKEDS